MNTKKLKSSIGQIRRSKSLIRLLDTNTKYQSIKGKNKVHNVDRLGDEKGKHCNGQKGKIKPVPKGFLAVYVGEKDQKFVIPATYLAMPNLRALMDDLADEYGYNNEGGLKLPCDEHEFEEVLRTCNNCCEVQKSKSRLPSKIVL